MSWVAAAIFGSTVVGGLLQSDATQSAAQTQADATRQSQAQLLAAGQKASEQYTPYTDLGKTSLASLTSQMPYWNQQFTAADLKSNLAPNYEFMKQQGLGATSQNINVGGGGSNANMARTKFAEDYASNAYQNAFNNFQTQRTNIYNQNQNLAAMGLTGAQGSANAQIGTGTNIASLTSGLGNAQAASQIAQGNIYGGIANTAGSMGAYSMLGNNAQNAAMQSQLSQGGYGSNALSNFTNNPSTNPGSSSFIGPIA
jgi:hypothetical protein